MCVCVCVCVCVCIYIYILYIYIYDPFYASLSRSVGQISVSHLTLYKCLLTCIDEMEELLYVCV